MKIEIEVDAERIHKDIVKELVDRLRPEVGYKIDQAMKGAIMAELLIELRKQVAERLPQMAFGDGRTFGQYIQELLERKHHGDYKERTRLVQIVEDRIYNEAHTLFAEIVKPYVKEFRDGVAKRITDQAISELAQH
jgi:hypothetical protein